MAPPCLLNMLFCSNAHKVAHYMHMNSFPGILWPTELRVTYLVPSWGHLQCWGSKQCSHVPSFARSVKLWAPCVDISVHVKERSGRQNYLSFFPAVLLIAMVALWCEATINQTPTMCYSKSGCIEETYWSKEHVSSIASCQRSCHRSERKGHEYHSQASSRWQKHTLIIV